MCAHHVRFVRTVHSRVLCLGAAGLLLLLSAGCSNWSRIGKPPTSAQQIETRVDAVRKRALIPGLSVSVVHGSSIWTYPSGVRDVGSGAPVTADTVFEAASLGKPVFAYAVLRLASLGRFDIDRPLSAYWVFPDLAGDERARKITAAMVLSHTSGLPNQRDSTGLRTVLEPGTGFLYSGEAFLYLQKVVEHVTGMDAETLVSQMVFRPFGMRNSSFVWQPEYNATAATGTDAAGLPVTKYRPDSPNVAGGLHTTSSDYARFLSMAMKQWGLSRKIRARMLKPAVKVWVGPGKDPDYVAWGLGFALQYSAEEGVSMWHWGDNNVFKAFAVAFPRRHIAMVYLSNGVGGLSIRDEVVDATVGGIHPAFHWLEIPQYRGRSGSDEQNPVFGNEP